MDVGSQSGTWSCFLTFRGNRCRYHKLKIKKKVYIILSHSQAYYHFAIEFHAHNQSF